jgi:hypothetical protein
MITGTSVPLVHSGQVSIPVCRQRKHPPNPQQQGHHTVRCPMHRLQYPGSSSNGMPTNFGFADGFPGRAGAVVTPLPQRAVRGRPSPLERVNPSRSAGHPGP